MKTAAPGKLLLFGEHAAVYGYPALGIALDRGMTVSWEYEKHTEWSLVLDGDGGLEAAPVQEDAFFDHLHRVLPRHITPERTDLLCPGAITIRPEVPLSSGFGSSAALCTALARIALDVPADADTENDRHAAWRLAHDLERFFHGTPSGIDTGLSALGGVQAFSFTEPGELPRARTTALRKIYLVAGSVPREQDTRSLVAGLRHRLERYPAETQPRLHELGEYSRRALEAVDTTSGGAAEIGTLADSAHETLRRLELSTPLIDAVLQEGRRAGALGGKLSGAGGGGAFFLVCAAPETAEYVLQRIREYLPRATTVFTVAPE